MSTETSITSLEKLGLAWKEFAKLCPDQTGQLVSFSNTLLTIAQRGWGDVRQRRTFATAAVWHLSAAMNTLLEVERNPPLGVVRSLPGRVFRLSQEGAAALLHVAEAQKAAEEAFPLTSGESFSNAALGLQGCADIEVNADRFHRAIMIYMLAWGHLATR